MNKINKNIYFFWILKIIFDMFYQIKILIIINFIFLLILLIHSLFVKKIVVSKNDIPIFLLFLLFSISFLKTPSQYTDYLKIISSFFIYFLGRMYYKEFESANKSLYISLFIAFFINLFICIIGKGTIIWGNAKTLRGVYFFKTDFAVMLLYFLVIMLYNSKKNVLNYFVVISTIFLIFLSNARIAYLCTILILYIFYLYKKKAKSIINFKTFIIIALFGLSTVYLLKLLSQTEIFINNNFISIKFNSLSDLFNASNTQGRNVIWQLLLLKFNSSGFLTRIFGAGMDFNSNYGLSGLNEHSTYIKVLLNTGYFGLLVFIIFILKTLLIIKKIKYRKLSFITVSVFIVYLIIGISVPTIMYTNCSWIPMFLIGMCISHYNSDNIFIDGQYENK